MRALKFRRILGLVIVLAAAVSLFFAGQGLAKQNGKLVGETPEIYTGSQADSQSMAGLSRKSIGSLGTSGNCSPIRNIYALDNTPGNYNMSVTGTGAEYRLSTLSWGRFSPTKWDLDSGSSKHYNISPDDACKIDNQAVYVNPAGTPGDWCMMLQVWTVIELSDDLVSALTAGNASLSFSWQVQNKTTGDSKNVADAQNLVWFYGNSNANLAWPMWGSANASSWSAPAHTVSAFSQLSTLTSAAYTPLINKMTSSGGGRLVTNPTVWSDDAAKSANLNATTYGKYLTIVLHAQMNGENDRVGSGLWNPYIKVTDTKSPESQAYYDYNTSNTSEPAAWATSRTYTVKIDDQGSGIDLDNTKFTLNGTSYTLRNLAQQSSGTYFSSLSCSPSISSGTVNGSVKSVTLNFSVKNGFRIQSTAIKDLGGNSASGIDSGTVAKVDPDAPTAKLNYLNNNVQVVGEPAGYARSRTIVITFSDPISGIDFADTKIKYGDSDTEVSLSALASSAINGGPDFESIALTSGSDGAATAVVTAVATQTGFKISASSAKDKAGNTSTPSASTEVKRIDREGPEVSLTGASDPDTWGASKHANYTVTDAKSGISTSVSYVYYKLSNGTLGSARLQTAALAGGKITVTGSGSNYTVSLEGMPTGFEILGFTVKDSLGNASGEEGAYVGETYRFLKVDSAAPVYVKSDASDAEVWMAEKTVTYTFSDELSGLDRSQSFITYNTSNQISLASDVTDEALLGGKYSIWTEGGDLKIRFTGMSNGFAVYGFSVKDAVGNNRAMNVNDQYTFAKVDQNAPAATRSAESGTEWLREKTVTYTFSDAQSGINRALSKVYYNSGNEISLSDNGTTSDFFGGSYEISGDETSVTIVFTGMDNGFEITGFEIVDNVAHQLTMTQGEGYKFDKTDKSVAEVQSIVVKGLNKNASFPLYYYNSDNLITIEITLDALLREVVCDGGASRDVIFLSITGFSVIEITPSDVPSGYVYTYTADFSGKPAGNVFISAYVKDEAGQTGEADVFGTDIPENTESYGEFYYENTAMPGFTASVDSEGSLTAQGWYNKAVVVSFALSGTEPENGVKVFKSDNTELGGISINDTFLQYDGTAGYYIIDTLGRRSEADTAAFKVDITAPYAELNADMGVVSDMWTSVDGFIVSGVFNGLIAGISGIEVYVKDGTFEDGNAVEPDEWGTATSFAEGSTVTLAGININQNQKRAIFIKAVTGAGLSVTANFIVKKDDAAPSETYAVTNASDGVWTSKNAVITSSGNPEEGQNGHNISGRTYKLFELNGQTDFTEDALKGYWGSGDGQTSARFELSPDADTYINKTYLLIVKSGAGRYCASVMSDADKAEYNAKIDGRDYTVELAINADFAYYTVSDGFTVADGKITAKIDSIFIVTVLPKVNKRIYSVTGGSVADNVGTRVFNKFEAAEDDLSKLQVTVSAEFKTELSLAVTSRLVQEVSKYGGSFAGVEFEIREGGTAKDNPFAFATLTYEKTDFDPSDIGVGIYRFSITLADTASYVLKEGANITDSAYYGELVCYYRDYAEIAAKTDKDTFSYNGVNHADTVFGDNIGEYLKVTLYTFDMLSGETVSEVLSDADAKNFIVSDYYTKPDMTNVGSYPVVFQNIYTQEGDCEILSTVTFTVEGTTAELEKKAVYDKFTKTYDGTAAVKIDGAVFTVTDMADYLTNNTEGFRFSMITEFSVLYDTADVSAVKVIIEVTGIENGGFSLPSGGFTFEFEAEIIAKEITIRQIADLSKDFDNTPSAEVNGRFSLSGAVDGEVIGLGFGSSEFSDKNALNKDGIIISVSLTGDTSGNYSLIADSLQSWLSLSGGTLTVDQNDASSLFANVINKKTISFEYGYGVKAFSNTGISGTVSLTEGGQPVFTGDRLTSFAVKDSLGDYSLLAGTVIGLSFSDTSSNVNTYVITPLLDTFTVDGIDMRHNYEVSVGSVSFSITTATVKVTVPGSGYEKTYTGAEINVTLSDFSYETDAVDGLKAYVAANFASAVLYIAESVDAPESLIDSGDGYWRFKSSAADANVTLVMDDTDAESNKAKIKPIEIEIRFWLAEGFKFEEGYSLSDNKTGADFNKDFDNNAGRVFFNKIGEGALISIINSASNVFSFSTRLYKEGALVENSATLEVATYVLRFSCASLGSGNNYVLNGQTESVEFSVTNEIPVAISFEKPNGLEDDSIVYGDMTVTAESFQKGLKQEGSSTFIDREGNDTGIAFADMFTVSAVIKNSSGTVLDGGAVYKGSYTATFEVKKIDGLTEEELTLQADIYDNFINNKIRSYSFTVTEKTVTLSIVMQDGSAVADRAYAPGVYDLTGSEKNTYFKVVSADLVFGDVIGSFNIGVNTGTLGANGYSFNITASDIVFQNSLGDGVTSSYAIDSDDKLTVKTSAVMERLAVTAEATVTKSYGFETDSGISGFTATANGEEVALAELAKIFSMNGSVPVYLKTSSDPYWTLAVGEHQGKYAFEKIAGLADSFYYTLAEESVKLSVTKFAMPRTEGSVTVSKIAGEDIQYGTAYSAYKAQITDALAASLTAKLNEVAGLAGEAVALLVDEIVAAALFKNGGVLVEDNTLLGAAVTSLTFVPGAMTNVSFEQSDAAFFADVVIIKAYVHAKFAEVGTDGRLRYTKQKAETSITEASAAEALAYLSIKYQLGTDDGAGGYIWADVADTANAGVYRALLVIADNGYYQIAASEGADGFSYFYQFEIEKASADTVTLEILAADGVNAFVPSRIYSDTEGIAFAVKVTTDYGETFTSGYTVRYYDSSDTEISYDGVKAVGSYKLEVEFGNGNYQAKSIVAAYSIEAASVNVTEGEVPGLEYTYTASGVSVGGSLDVSADGIAAVPGAFTFKVESGTDTLLENTHYTLSFAGNGVWTIVFIDFDAMIAGYKISVGYDFGTESGNFNAYTGTEYLFDVVPRTVTVLGGNNIGNQTYSGDEYNAYALLSPQQTDGRIFSLAYEYRLRESGEYTGEVTGHPKTPGDYKLFVWLTNSYNGKYIIEAAEYTFAVTAIEASLSILNEYQGDNAQSMSLDFDEAVTYLDLIQYLMLTADFHSGADEDALKALLSFTAVGSDLQQYSWIGGASTLPNAAGMQYDVRVSLDAEGYAMPEFIFTVNVIEESKSNFGTLSLDGEASDMLERIFGYDGSLPEAIPHTLSDIDISAVDGKTVAEWGIEGATLLFSYKYYSANDYWEKVGLASPAEAGKYIVEITVSDLEGNYNAKIFSKKILINKQAEAGFKQFVEDYVGFDAPEDLIKDFDGKRLMPKAECGEGDTFPLGITYRLMITKGGLEAEILNAGIYEAEYTFTSPNFEGTVTKTLTYTVNRAKATYALSGNQSASPEYSKNGYTFSVGVTALAESVAADIKTIDNGAGYTLQIHYSQAFDGAYAEVSEVRQLGFYRLVLTVTDPNGNFSVDGYEDSFEYTIEVADFEVVQRKTSVVCNSVPSGSFDFDRSRTDVAYDIALEAEGSALEASQYSVYLEKEASQGVWTKYNVGPAAMGKGSYRLAVEITDGNYTVDDTADTLYYAFEITAKEIDTVSGSYDEEIEYGEVFENTLVLKDGEAVLQTSAVWYKKLSDGTWGAETDIVPVDAGTYKMVVSLRGADADNYRLSLNGYTAAGTSGFEVQFVITPAKVTVAEISIPEAVYTYGSSKQYTAADFTFGITYAAASKTVDNVTKTLYVKRGNGYAGISPAKNVGEYKLVLTLGSNFVFDGASSEKEYVFDIEAQKITSLEADGWSEGQKYIYSGTSPVAVAVSGSCADGKVDLGANLRYQTYSNGIWGAEGLTRPSNAGIYRIVVKDFAEGSNYVLETAQEDRYFGFEIEKKLVTVKYEGANSFAYSGQPVQLSLSVAGTVSQAEVLELDIVYKKVIDGTETDTAEIRAMGDYKVYVSLRASDKVPSRNYKAEPIVLDITVRQGTLNRDGFEYSASVLDYNGESRIMTINKYSNQPAGFNIGAVTVETGYEKVLKSGTSELVTPLADGERPKDAGSYRVTFTVKCEGFTDTVVVKTLIINAVALEVNVIRDDGKLKVVPNIDDGKLEYRIRKSGGNWGDWTSENVFDADKGAQYDVEVRSTDSNVSNFSNISADTPLAAISEPKAAPSSLGLILGLSIGIGVAIAAVAAAIVILVIRKKKLDSIG